jgi:hypothetical protein
MCFFFISKFYETGLKNTVESTSVSCVPFIPISQFSFFLIVRSEKEKEGFKNSIPQKDSSSDDDNDKNHYHSRHENNLRKSFTTPLAIWILSMKKRTSDNANRNIIKPDVGPPSTQKKSERCDASTCYSHWATSIHISENGCNRS